MTFKRAKDHSFATCNVRQIGAQIEDIILNPRFQALRILFSKLDSTQSQSCRGLLPATQPTAPAFPPVHSNHHVRKSSRAHRGVGTVATFQLCLAGPTHRTELQNMNELGSDKSLEQKQAIESFDIDGRPADLTFAARLARENRWDQNFADQVVVQYKRFIFLVATQPTKMTPSDQVEQAWHLHLTYTDSYWNRMCGQTIGRPIHHNPMADGESEEAKHREQYTKTLESYRSVFDWWSPDLWPPVNERFSKAYDGKRVLPFEYLMIPKKCAKAVVRTTTIMAFVFAVIAGFGVLMARNPAGISARKIVGWTFVAVFGVLYGFLFLLVILCACQQWANDSRQSGSSHREGGAVDGGGCGGCGGCGVVISCRWSERTHEKHWEKTVAQLSVVTVACLFSHLACL
jgi:hypothetical protein